MNPIVFDPAQVGIPRGLPLPLPVPTEVLQVLMVALFLLHILFVNLMVGGAVLTFVYEWLGLKTRRYDDLAHAVANTITVNKSLAVVLGVGPLLVINLLYTTEFYAANILTGHVWILLVPLIALAFLLTYLHKFTWHRWTGPAKGRHVALAGVNAALFLFIPVIFLANINLMLFPDTWSRIGGFVDALTVGNVLPRYLHFLMATMAVNALFLAFWFRRKRFDIARIIPDFTRPALVRHFCRLAFRASALQLLVGPLLLLTLPRAGLSNDALRFIAEGAALGILAIYLLWRETQAPDALVGRRLPQIAIVLSLVVVGMGQGRHLYREASLAPFRERVFWKTAEFRAVEYGASIAQAAGRSLTAPADPRDVFNETCGSCHNDSGRVAPARSELQGLFKGNPGAIIAWAKAPGRKRPQYRQMPSFAQLDDKTLRALALIMLGDEAALEAEAEPTGQDTGPGYTGTRPKRQ